MIFLNSTLIGQSRYNLIRNELTLIDSLTVVKVQDSGFTTYCDSTFDSRYLKFWSDILKEEHQKLVDTVGCSPYSSELFVYKSKVYQDYLIFWTTNYEYASDILVYILNNRVLTKMGQIKIQNNCETCDDVIYPLNWFKIIGYKDSIVIIPTKEFRYEVEKENWQSFKPNEATIMLDKKNKNLSLKL
jgi:hypothetical protein